MWIARNEDGSLHLWVLSGKPSKLDGSNFSSGLGMWKFSIDTGHKLPDELFPEVTWETEPKEVFLNTGYNMVDQINHVWAMLKCTQDELAKVQQSLVYYKTKVESIDRIINEP